MTRRERLAQEAVFAALRVRARVGLAPDAPACPYAIAEALDVKILLEPLASLEGMYSPDVPVIVLGSLRPASRRSFTCGHELGHHVLGHGLRVDELVESSGRTVRDDAEYTADRFSAALLMPKLAVVSAFRQRGWFPAQATPEQVYVVAGALGVGYATLVGYLNHTLHELTEAEAARLAAERTSKIRSRILGFSPPRGLLVVDQHWTTRPADVEVGDHLTLPAGAEMSGEGLVPTAALNECQVVTAACPGRYFVSLPGDVVVEVRVSRPGFRGLALYRYLEDADDDV